MKHLIIDEETYITWLKDGILTTDGIFLSYRTMKEDGDFERLQSGEVIQKDKDTTIELDPSITYEVLFGLDDRVSFPDIKIHYTT